MPAEVSQIVYINHEAIVADAETGSQTTWFDQIEHFKISPVLKLPFLGRKFPSHDEEPQILDHPEGIGEKTLRFWQAHNARLSDQYNFKKRSGGNTCSYFDGYMRGKAAVRVKALGCAVPRVHRWHGDLPSVVCHPGVVSLLHYINCGGLDWFEAKYQIRGSEEANRLWFHVFSARACQSWKGSIERTVWWYSFNPSPWLGPANLWRLCCSSEIEHRGNCRNPMLSYCASRILGLGSGGTWWPALCTHALGLSFQWLYASAWSPARLPGTSSHSSAQPWWSDGAWCGYGEYGEYQCPRPSLGKWSSQTAGLFIAGRFTKPKAANCWHFPGGVHDSTWRPAWTDAKFPMGVASQRWPVQWVAMSYSDESMARVQLNSCHLGCHSDWDFQDLAH